MTFMRALFPKTDGKSSFEIISFFSTLEDAFYSVSSCFPGTVSMTTCLRDIFLLTHSTHGFFCYQKKKKNLSNPALHKGFVNGNPFVHGESHEGVMMLQQPKRSIALNCFCLNVTKPRILSLFPAQ